MTQNQLIKATDFTQEEIQLISKYILANVPYSVLEQIFPLTENPIKKTEVFTVVYRIINSAQGYVHEKETKEKLRLLLESCKEEYEDLYNISLQLKMTKFRESMFKYKMRKIFSNYDRNFKINNLIDVFLVFAEKHVLRDMNKLVGISTDINLKGSEIVDDLAKLVKD